MKCFILGLCALCATTALRAASASDLYYEVLGGAAVITGCAEHASGALEIPSTLGGCPVTMIVEAAFEECGNLTSVKIPASVFDIAPAAFVGQTNLSISVDSANQYYSSDENGILFNKNKTVLHTAAKVGASYTLPESVTEIEECAFLGCTTLESLTIPARITRIGVDAFGGCSNLVFSVDSNNSAYCSIDGSLFTKDQKTLLRVSADVTDYTVPSGVTLIDDEAFSVHPRLTSVTVSEGVTAIGNFTFGECPRLATVILPSSLTLIANEAFYGCPSLTKVVFKCSPNISVGEELFADTDSAVGYYTSHYQSQWQYHSYWNGLPMQYMELPSYDVSLTAVGGGSVSGGGKKTEGDKVTVVATAPTGYVFCGWSTTPTVMTPEYSFTMPAENVALTAYFAPRQAIEQYVADNELITKDDVKEMAFDTPLVEVGSDEIEIAISLQTADSLDAWEAMALEGATMTAEDGMLRVRVPKGNKKAAFYKFVVPTDQSK